MENFIVVNNGGTVKKFTAEADAVEYAKNQSQLNMGRPFVVYKPIGVAQNPSNVIEYKVVS